MRRPLLRAIGRATPDRALTPESGLALAERFSEGVHGERLERLYRDAGVSSRGSTLLDPTGRQPLYSASSRGGPSTSARLAHFMHAACDLGERAAREALERAETQARAITHLITVSCTGAESPGLDHALMARLGLSSDVSRTHVGFMGCHGALNALALGSAFCSAESRANVLVVCVELCSLHYRIGATWDQEVANAIFADGAACAVIRSGERGWCLSSFGSRVFPNTAGLMSWRIGDHGFEMRLSARVPGVIRRSIGPWIDGWLASCHLAREDVAGWAAHPGGRDIVEGVRRGLGLTASDMRHSLRVLDRHGNMSSGTVLWVLDDLIRSNPRGHLIGLSFGPGLSGEAVLVSRVG